MRRRMHPPLAKKKSHPDPPVLWWSRPNVYTGSMIEGTEGSNLNYALPGGDRKRQRLRTRHGVGICIEKYIVARERTTRMQTAGGYKAPAQVSFLELADVSAAERGQGIKTHEMESRPIRSYASEREAKKRKSLRTVRRMRVKMILCGLLVTGQVPVQREKSQVLKIQYLSTWRMVADGGKARTYDGWETEAGPFLRELRQVEFRHPAPVSRIEGTHQLKSMHGRRRCGGCARRASPKPEKPSDAMRMPSGWCLLSHWQFIHNGGDYSQGWSAIAMHQRPLLLGTVRPAQATARDQGKMSSFKHKKFAIPELFNVRHVRNWTSIKFNRLDSNFSFLGDGSVNGSSVLINDLIMVPFSESLSFSHFIFPHIFPHLLIVLSHPQAATLHIHTRLRRPLLSTVIWSRRHANGGANASTTRHAAGDGPVGRGSIGMGITTGVLQRPSPSLLSNRVLTPPAPWIQRHSIYANLPQDAEDSECLKSRVKAQAIHNPKDPLPSSSVKVTDQALGSKH
ncbi:hypothetical protein DFH06DRAFT_1124974 [Mycena polygramma]|nr:hypothetical protein DFH06DRAFT_1124974 [Mycena polygramma]